ncbi:MAG: metallophosphoesterase [Alkalispirochaetaceae bacterium]
MSKRSMRREAFSYNNLLQLYRGSPEQELTDEDRYVIFSDLHMGTGKGSDDFLNNSGMFIAVLRDYYLPRGYKLILNGDVEELQRFRMPRIKERWQEVYELFEEFERRNGFTRIVGNHDLYHLSGELLEKPVLEGLRFRYPSGELFIFHGHQASKRYEKYNHWVAFCLKYLATPLRIRNYSVSHDSRKRFKTERRVYDFASDQKIISIIGHTHRPLFESMSKRDSITFEIERLVRKYPKYKERKQVKIEEKVNYLKQELYHLVEQNPQAAETDSLYRESLVVPCMFNSGCVLGKRGMTNLEIEAGKMRLSYWYDANRPQKYLQYRNREREQLDGSPYQRVIINEDTLEYIFSKIRLLA